MTRAEQLLRPGVAMSIDGYFVGFCGIRPLYPSGAYYTIPDSPPEPTLLIHDKDGEVIDTYLSPFTDNLPYLIERLKGLGIGPKVEAAS